MEYEMFVDHSSAGELGTSMASINCTGKSNAAKGVENHYNEYSEFNLRETEWHVVASFMEMMGMKNMEGSIYYTLFFFLKDVWTISLSSKKLSVPMKTSWVWELCSKEIF